MVVTDVSRSGIFFGHIRGPYNSSMTEIHVYRRFSKRNIFWTSLGHLNSQKGTFVCMHKPRRLYSRTKTLIYTVFWLIPVLAGESNHMCTTCNLDGGPARPVYRYHCLISSRERFRNNIMYQNGNCQHSC